MYFLVAMAVGIIPIFLLTLIGGLIANQKVGKEAGIGFGVGVGYGLVLWLIYWASHIGFYGPSPFAWEIIIGAIIAGIICYFATDEGKSTIPSWIAGGGYILYILIVVLWLGQSDMMNSNGKVQLIGTVKTVTELNSIMEPADNAHICQVFEAAATVTAQKALSQFKIKGDIIPGSRYTIGKPTKCLVKDHLWWVYPLEFQGYWKWNQDPEVPGYLRVSAENPLEPAQAVQIDGKGNEIHIKYLNSACFQNQAERYLRTEKGYMNAILQDWTFEPDDNWRPYYTVSVMERKFGYAGYTLKGVIRFDLQTGECSFDDKDHLAKWVDRAIPLDVLDYNAKKWGKFANASWGYTFTKNDKSQQPTPGWFLTYSKGQCYWFSGFTSMADDKALTGFVTMNARTGETSFFKAEGTTEDLAYDAAKTMWNNFPGYEPTELVPYNIYGHLTYVIPMSCKGQLSGISLVALDNLNLKSSGKDFSEAVRNYRDAMVQLGSTGLAPQSGQAKVVELTGTVERVGTISNKSVMSFKLVGIGKIFQVVYSDDNPKTLLLKEGDKVVLTYLETTETLVSVSKFDIPIIVLESGSVTQAKYVENKQNTDKEVKRVDDQQKVETIINSDAVKDVDPEALQKFLDDQKAKKAK